VRVVYKHYVVHPDTVMMAHLAACAAGKQGKFLPFMKGFWEKGYGEYQKTRDPKSMSEENILKIAKDAGVDTGKLKTEMNGEQCKERIKADMAELSKFGVNGTPSFFVNGRFTMFSGPDAFKALIDSELKVVEASGEPPDQYYQKVVMEKGEKKFKSKVKSGG
jgi:protein-disulfide isomerase